MSRTLASCLCIVVVTSALAVEVDDNSLDRGDKFADDEFRQLRVTAGKQPSEALPGKNHPATTQTTAGSAISQDEMNALRLARAHGISIKNAHRVIDHPRARKPAQRGGDNVEIGLVARLARARRGLQSENAEDAIHEIKLLAEIAAEHEVGSVSAAAQFQLGELYYAGRIVPHDEALAITYYRMAAFGGHQGAQIALSTIYRQVGLPLPEFPAAVARTDTRRSVTPDITFSGFVEFAQLLPLASDVSFDLRNFPSYVPLTRASLIKQLDEQKRPPEEHIGGKKALSTSALDTRFEPHGRSGAARKYYYNSDVEAWACYCLSPILAA